MTEILCTRDGITLDDQPFYLLAGQLHYFRFPPAEWRGLLLTAKAAGLNTVDTVIPWNLHEPQPGQFNFTGLANLPGYLDLCAELGLSVIARPGPYICAEWENGGLPAWLATEPGIAYRLDNPAYLAAIRRWFDVLIPLLAERQAGQGGPVILVQIENEHWASGVYGHDAHQATLARALAERGITVPLYTCMGAGRSWPEFRNGWAGIDQKLLQTRSTWPDTPLIVSELWSGWFDNWGSSRHNGKSAAALDGRLHELLAIGCSGFSHWMWAGGTNFAFWGGRTVDGDTVHMTTSYDYDAPVSEYGGLTAKFFVARRHHLFLASLGSAVASRLAEANAAGPRVISARAVAGRSGGGGEALRSVRLDNFTATFLRNDTLDRQSYRVFPDPETGPALTVAVEAASIKPVFTNLPLGESGLSLRYHTGRLLGFWEIAGTAVLIGYGFEGEVGQVALDGGAWQVDDADGVECATRDNTLSIHYWLADRPTMVRASVRPGSTSPARPVVIILLTEVRAERCWPVGEAGFLAGPHYLYGQEQTKDGSVRVQVDSRGSSPFYWLGLDGRRRVIPAPTPLPLPEPPILAQWEELAVEELAAESGWQNLDRPVPLEALDCPTGYGWYRARVELPPGETILAAPGLADRGALFVDGRYTGTFGIGPAGPTLALPLPRLSAGPHDLRLRVDNLGRFNYGSNLGERKGLTDTLYVGGRQEDITRGWTALWQEASFAGEAIAGAHPAHVRPDAAGVDLASFAFSGPDVWLLREIEVPAGRQAVLYLTGDRNPGALYVNGHPVARFSRHFGGGYFKYDVTDHLTPHGSNVVTLYIRDYAGLPWHAWLLTYDPTRPLPATWSFRPGVTPSLNSKLKIQNSKFLRAHFSYNPSHHGPGPFKLSLVGLRKGQLWLNGENLGRYWQIGPQEFYKVPVSWLRPENELLIFEEEGGDPAGVRLRVDDLGAGRAAWLTLS